MEPCVAVNFRIAHHSGASYKQTCRFLMREEHFFRPALFVARHVVLGQPCVMISRIGEGPLPLMDEVDLPFVRLVLVMVESRHAIQLRLPVKLISPVVAKIDKELAIKPKCPVRVRYSLGQRVRCSR
jgi:hypothetical protein